MKELDEKKIGRIARLLSASAIEIRVDKEGAKEFRVAFLHNDDEVGFVEMHLESVERFEEMMEESVGDDYVRTISRIYDDYARICEISDFEIYCEWRGNHFARPALSMALERMKTQGGFCAFVLRSLPQGQGGLGQQELVGFYRSLGFEECGDFGDEGIIMHKAL